MIKVYLVAISTCHVGFGERTLSPAFEPLEGADLKHLSFKTAVLILTLAKQVSNIMLFGPSLIHSVHPG